MPDLDLILTRNMKVAPERVWRAWTEPALLKHWFASKPIETRDIVMNLYPGWAVPRLMVALDGAECPNEGCVLLVERARHVSRLPCGSR